MPSIVRPALARQARLVGLPSQKLSAHSTSASLLRTLDSRPLRTSSPSFFYQKMCLLNRVTAFHTSSRHSILPPLPQKIEGTANEPVPVPPPSPTHGSYHWTFERLVAAGLVPLTVVPFAVGSLNPSTDALLCALLIIHSHIGFESIIIDYLPEKRTPKSRLAAGWGLRAATLVVAVGLYEFETNDVGITEAVKRVWTA